MWGYRLRSGAQALIWNRIHYGNQLFVSTRTDLKKISSVSYSKWSTYKQINKLHSLLDEKSFLNDALKHGHIYYRNSFNSKYICTSSVCSANKEKNRIHNKRKGKEIDLNDKDYKDTVNEYNTISQQNSKFEENENFYPSIDFIETADKDVLGNANVKKSGIEMIQRMFPEPKAVLHNYQQMLGKKILDSVYKQNTIKHKGKNKANPHNCTWTCTVKFSWPEKFSIEGTGVTKSLAYKKAFHEALLWLYLNNRINDRGKPIHSRDDIHEIKKDLNLPITLSVDNDHIEKIIKLNKEFNRNIKPTLQTSETKVADASKELPSDLRPYEIEDEEDLLGFNTLDYAPDKQYVEPIFGKSLGDKDPILIERRSKIMHQKLMERTSEIQLPITQFKQKLIKAVEDTRAIVIQGAPGCGKSTCVPSYILDNWTANNKGGECNIIVSEPRRVAALSLANTVASQRGENVGDVCGYQVRLSTFLPRQPGGVILFCTAGALLRRLIVSPDLPGCSHLVLDEAHERSSDIDTVMALAKKAMDLNPNLKVIVMSATIDTHLFSRYFNNCPIFEVPGFMYPVQSHFLNNFPKPLLSRLENTRKVSDYTGDYNRTFVSPIEVAEVINWVHKSKPEGAILVFLPGWGEISKVKLELEKITKYDSTICVLPIHSRLSNEDQHKIFSRTSPGIRKVILATNIAETSITVNDVSYVIDTGIHRELTLLASQGISSLNSTWVSKANVKQRKGRAGRVKPGECFHMYSEAKMSTFDENPTPEILRVPLEKTVLDCKSYCIEENVTDFLNKFPQPPSNEAIRTAINDLMTLGAFDESENLTPLGKRIMSFTTHPKLSKALVYSTIFKATSPVVDIATILSNNTDLFSCSVDNKQDVRELKRKYHSTSDHLAAYWLNQHFQYYKSKHDNDEVNNFCKTQNIRRERINSVEGLREICISHLQQCNLLSDIDYQKGQSFEELDKYAKVNELVKGILFCGLNTILRVKNRIKTHGKLAKVKELYTDNGSKAFLTSESVNYNIEKKADSAILLYCGAIHSQERRGILVKDSSVLSPLTTFLFSSQIQKVFQDDENVIFRIGNQIKLQCSQEQAPVLLEFRNAIWKIANWYLENEDIHKSSKQFSHLLGDDSDDEPDNLYENKDIHSFRENLLKHLAEILLSVENNLNS